MLFLYKNYQIILIIIEFIFLFQITLIYSEDKIIENSISNFINIEGKLILIFENNLTIYDLNNYKAIGEYNANIQSQKDITYIKDGIFIISGLNNKRQFIFQSFVLLNENLTENSAKILDLGLDEFNIEKYYVRSSIENSITLSLLYEKKEGIQNFGIYLIDLHEETNFYKGKTFPHSNSDIISILCDSFDGSYIFCIFNLEGKNSEGQSTYTIQYIYAELDKLGDELKNVTITKNCFLEGDFVKIIDKSIRKFLVCYFIPIGLNNDDKKQNIVCRYLIIKDHNIVIENENIIVQESKKYDKKLILKVFGYSIFVESEQKYYSSFISFLTILPFDLSFTIELNDDNINVSNIVNYKNSNFILYRNRQNNLYYIKNQSFIESDIPENYYFSKNDSIIVPFEINHSNQNIYFSLDESTILYYNKGIINSKEMNHFNLNNNSTFEFKKVGMNNGISNYYCYYISNNDIIIACSLIKKITLKICHETCMECNMDKISLPTTQYCKKCNDDYYPLISEITNIDGFNCYNETERIPYYYYNDSINNGTFDYCDDTCKYCINKTFCEYCKDGYYFMVDEKNETKILYDKQCFNTTPPSYYYNHTVNLKNEKNELIKAAYKPCYETCLTCDHQGNSENHGCNECKKDLIKYAFNKNNCLLNVSFCKESNYSKYWEYEENNITCLNSCRYSLITTGLNKGQCVKDCQNYINPYFNYIDDSILYLNLSCDEESYCVAYISCSKLKFRKNVEGTKCLSNFKCTSYDIYKYNDPYEYFESLFSPVIDLDPSDLDEYREKINKRIKIIKILKNNTNDYDNIDDESERSLIEYYNDLLQVEKSSYNNSNDKYLLASIEYNYFTITIYPLDIEEFAYEQIFSVNNLGFVNFTKTYPNFINNEVDNHLILVCTYEYHEKKSSTKDLNYFLFKFNENNNGNTDIGYPFNLNSKELQRKSDKLEISYPLHNYYDENSLANKRNSENLLDNIKEVYSNYPEIDLTNKSDPFFNDICFLFTSDFGTDMTLNDRRNEYYLGSSVCEDNCEIIKTINKDSNPRALCNCDIKNFISYNNRKGKKDEIESISTPNIRSFVCGKETFNFKIGKNGIFWIFIIILIFQIAFLIKFILYKKEEVNKILGLYENNSVKIISSSEGNILEFKKTSTQKNDNAISNPIKKNLFKNEENISNPPKKKDLKLQNNTSTKGEIKVDEKDLISGNGSSYIKDNSKRYNEKNPQDFTDISFDDINNGDDQYYIDNIIKQRKMLKNNFLNNPLLLERAKKFENAKNSLKSLNENESKKFNNSFEDNLFSCQNKNKRKRKNKLKVDNRKYIANILGGQDIYNKDLIKNNSDCEDKQGYPKKKLKNKNNGNKNDNLVFEEEKGDMGDEQIIFSGGALKDGDNFLIDNSDNNNNNKHTIIKSPIINIFGSKNNNTLTKSLGKKQDEKNNEKNGKLITEVGIDTKYKLNKDLLKKGKGEIRPHSNIGISGRQKGRNNNSSNNNLSIESDFNALIKTSTVQPLKLRDKNHHHNQKKENNKEASKEIDSNRLMINNQEREIYRDRIQPYFQENNIRQYNSNNIDILKSSTSSFLEEEKTDELINENFMLFFWKYFIKRELGYVCIAGARRSIPYFVRFSCLVFSISFIFLLNCFLFLESAVHKRYLNASTGKKNRLGYYFKEEFGMTCCAALLGNVFKIIIIKLLLYKLFKIGKEQKKLMRSSEEKGLNQDELFQLQFKRLKYLNDYNRNLNIYYICLIVLNVFISYICICYGGVFQNSIGAFIYGFIFSLIMSYLFCAVICFIIVCIYKLGKRFDNKCIVLTYTVCSTLY